MKRNYQLRITSIVTTHKMSNAKIELNNSMTIDMLSLSFSSCTADLSNPISTPVLAIASLLLHIVLYDIARIIDHFNKLDCSPLINLT